MAWNPNHRGGCHTLKHSLNGIYVPSERELRIVVHGRQVEQSEMRDACAARAFMRDFLGEDKPIDNVGYVFLTEQEALAHLHELWLRELRCYAIIKGEERRLDLDYRPERRRPDWVQKVLTRENLEDPWLGDY